MYTKHKNTSKPKKGGKSKGKKKKKNQPVSNNDDELIDLMEEYGDLEAEMEIEEEKAPEELEPIEEETKKKVEKAKPKKKKDLEKPKKAKPKKKTRGLIVSSRSKPDKRSKKLIRYPCVFVKSPFAMGFLVLFSKML